MKIWFISDTHCKHEKLIVPDVDLVIHCGDESESRDVRDNEPESRSFLDWYEDIKIPTKIFVPGNHSTAVEHGAVVAQDYPTIRFLIHEPTEWMGLKIFGSPYTPQFFDWAYMKPREDLDAVWQTIPDDTNILITHGPPKGVLDVTRDFKSGAPIHVGSKSLRLHVEERIKPKIHAFGHIHDERDINNCGKIDCNGILFINCSVCDNSGTQKNQGFVLTVDEWLCNGP